MSMFYSPTERGFFNSQLHKELPADAVAITKARHGELIAAQAEGAQIVPDRETGRPFALWPDDDQLRRNLIAATKAEAQRRIEAIMPLYAQLNALRSEQTMLSEQAQTAFVGIDAIRAASNAIEQDIAKADPASLATYAIGSHPLWPTPSDTSTENA